MRVWLRAGYGMYDKEGRFGHMKSKCLAVRGANIVYQSGYLYFYICCSSFLCGMNHPFRVLFSHFQLVHFVNRDSEGLANDFLSLGFIPEGVVDLQAISDALQASFEDGTRERQDFQVYISVSFGYLSMVHPFIC